ncbi:MAG: transglycosylase domain-containing protein, partial [Bacteroidota bacterium]
YMSSNDPTTPPTPEEQPSTAAPKKSTFEAPKRKVKGKYKPVRKGFLIFVGIIFFISVGFLGFLATDLPPMTLIENPESDLSTQLVSADGVVLSRYYSKENRVNVRLNEVSPWVVNALIATEDVRFYGHSGVDPKSFFSILFSIIKGEEVRGGSTITMQLSRNLYDEVGGESKYIRKLKEYLVSAYIERRFTKQEIMEAYLNTVNIWGNSYGIETTARRLFDKNAKDLTIEEAALVVGMLKGQGVYNPFRYEERTQNRRNIVLEQMAKYDFIDETQYKLDSLKAIPISQSLVKQEQEHIKGLATYFREHIRTWLKQWCEDNNYSLYTDGLKVYTSIDSRMQAHAESAVREHLTDLQSTFDKVERRGDRLFKADPKILDDLKRQSYRYISAKKRGLSPSEIDKEFHTKREMTVYTWKGEKTIKFSPMDSIRHYARFLETGMVSIDPSNGHVKAWVGGINYKYFQYDHVAQGKRQVGSTFKPFVYGTVITNDYTPCEEILNQPVTFPDEGGGIWKPKNSDGSFGGKMTLKRGLANSVNLITAQLMKDYTTPTAVAEFAYNMGIKSKLDEVPSLCLGTTDLSVLELTSAYSTWANMGINIEPILVTRIENRFGEVLWQAKTQSQEVMKPEHAYEMIELLKGVVDQGTAMRLRFKYQFRNEIGGKTGTTQNQSDGWFIGMTPELVTGVWVGASDRRVHFRSIKYGQGANMALPIWALYMKSVFADNRINMTKVRFERPEGFNINLNCRSINEKKEEDIKNAPSSDD